MAAMAMPRDAGDDLWLYMRKIIEEEFPKALRQAFYTLWDKKYAPKHGPLDGSYHWSRQFDALENNFCPLMFPTGNQFTLDSFSSKSFEELDFEELCRILTNLRFLKVPGYVPKSSNLWLPLFESTKPGISNIDEESFLIAVYKLMELNQQHVNCEGRMNSQLLKRQLAQARGVFTTLGVTLNDSKNAIAFSAAGLQDLILEWRKIESSHPLFISSGFGYFGAFSSKQVRRDLNIWVKGKYLGGGTFGKVFSLTHRESGIKVAMKEVKIESQCSESQEEVKQLENELVKLRRLRHPRIVRVHGIEPKGDFIYLFLDFMAGGSLRDFIKQSGKLDERLTRKFTRQILEGVDYLHDNEVTHRDIKGPNILLDSDRSVKLADFGVSKKIQKIGTRTDLKSFVGTTFWMAPEILRGKRYGRKVDIWSVGCTVVEMLTGDPPLKNLEPQAAMFRIGSEPLDVQEELPESTEEARDFVRAALTWDPTERPNCKELLTHSFVEVKEEELT